MKWKKKSESVLWEGRRKIIDRVFEMPDGSEEHFEIKLESHPVSIVAITSDKKVIITKQFRPGPEEVLMEIPGGFVDKGESPETAASRELLEETGYKAKEIERIGSWWSDAYSTMARHVFLATGCKKIQEPQLGEHEYIEVVEVSLPKFRQILKTGALTDAASGYMALDYLNLL